MTERDKKLENSNPDLGCRRKGGEGRGLGYGRGLGRGAGRRGGLNAQLGRGEGMGMGPCRKKMSDNSTSDKNN